jgi:tetratricopeptide (TPR) repeat protein
MSTFVEAVDYLERALELLPTVYPSSSDVQAYRDEADLLTQLGETRYYTGDYVAAATCLRSSLDLYRELGDRSSEARALVLMGDVLWRQSEYADAADERAGPRSPRRARREHRRRQRAIQRAPARA